MINKEKKFNALYITVFCIYINFFIHGIGASILAQNTKSFQALWNTNHAAVLYVISALGIGRFIALPFSGVMSDKLGRRITIIIGMVFYALFFGLIFITPNSKIGFFVALFAGIANSFLDSGCIPAAMEILVNSTGFASILTKLFISIGQFLLPMIVGFLAGNNIYFGYSFIFCIILLVINGVFLLKLPFPKQNEVKKSENKEEIKPAVKSNFYIEGVALIIIGYTSTATFQIFLNINKAFGTDMVGLSEMAAGRIQSNYAMGSILAVIITAFLVKKFIKPVRFLFIYPLISLITLVGMFFIRTESMTLAGGFIIGFSAAGGVLQLAVSTMADLFPVSKGKITSMIMLSSSVATFTVTALAGYITHLFGIEYTLIFAGVITAIGVLLSLAVNFRYNILAKQGA